MTVRESAYGIVLRPVSVVVGADGLIEILWGASLRPNRHDSLRTTLPVVLGAKRDPVAAAFLKRIELHRAIRLEGRCSWRLQPAQLLDDRRRVHRRACASQNAKLNIERKRTVAGA